MTSTYVRTPREPDPAPAALADELRRIDDLLRAGHTPHEVADLLHASILTITDRISRIRKRSRDLFRRQRAAERAQAYDDCHRIQQTLWKVIEHLMSEDVQDPKAVPQAARAYLDAAKFREALRDAEDKHVQDGDLSVRDIFAAIDPVILDGPRPSSVLVAATTTDDDDDDDSPDDDARDG